MRNYRIRNAVGFLGDYFLGFDKIRRANEIDYLRVGDPRHERITQALSTYKIESLLVNACTTVIDFTAASLPLVAYYSGDNNDSIAFSKIAAATVLGIFEAFRGVFRGGIDKNLESIADGDIPMPQRDKDEIVTKYTYPPMERLIEIAEYEQQTNTGVKANIQKGLDPKTHLSSVILKEFIQENGLKKKVKNNNEVLDRVAVREIAAQCAKGYSLDLEELTASYMHAS